MLGKIPHVLEFEPYSPAFVNETRTAFPDDRGRCAAATGGRWCRGRTLSDPFLAFQIADAIKEHGRQTFAEWTAACELKRNCDGPSSINITGFCVVRPLSNRCQTL